MAENAKSEAQLREDLKKVEAQSLAKMMRHRVDDYLAIILAVGTVTLLWLLQWLGFY